MTTTASSPTPPAPDTVPHERPAAISTSPGARHLADLGTRLGLGEGIQDELSVIESTLSIAAIAEEEISSAQLRHGDHHGGTGHLEIADRLWRSFLLLRPTGVMIDRAAFVYRAHCREILNRVASREDTRPATDAEMILALSHTSLAVPLNAPATGLYMRLFTRAFPDQAATAFGAVDRTVEDYERLYRDQINDHEAFLRHRARQDWRTQTRINAET